MFKKYLKKTVGIALFLLLISFYFTAVASAGPAADLQTQLQNAGKLSWGGEALSGNTSMTGIVATVVEAFLGLLGVIFLVLIIYAGFEWMTAQGDEKKVDTAKDTLTRAVIGLIIIIAAYSITYFVFTSLPGGDTVGTTGTTGVNETPRR